MYLFIFPRSVGGARRQGVLRCLNSGEISITVLVLYIVARGERARAQVESGAASGRDEPDVGVQYCL